MPDDSGGNYSLPDGYLAVAGHKVEPSNHNPPLEDIANSLTNRISRDGRSIWTGDQNAGEHKITNLAAGEFETDAVNLSQLLTPIADKAAAQAMEIPQGVHSILLRGFNSENDGLGGQWTDDPAKGSGDTFNDAGGRTWHRVDDVDKLRFTDDTITYINGPKHVKKEKWIISSDWQPVNTDPDQITYLQSVFDNMAEHHSDAKYVICPGDLVDSATSGSTGADPVYGYPELRRDFESRVGLSWDALFSGPGNHDRNSTGIATNAEAWTYKRYRRDVGPEFYYVTRGNIAVVMVGDMAGSNSGEILTPALEWLDRSMDRLRNYNCFMFFHQPIHGAHSSSTSDTSGLVQYKGDERLKPILQKYKDQIAFCGYGHVGSSYSNGIESKVVDDIIWINFSLAIPSLADDDWEEHGIYSYVELESGSEEIVIKRWDVEDSINPSEYDITVSLPHPLDLGSDKVDFDGRKYLDWHSPVVRNYLQIIRSQGEDRVYRDADSTWAPPAGPTVMLRLTLMDDSLDTYKTTRGTALLFDVPGAATVTDSTGNSVAAYPNGYGDGVMIAAENLSGDASIYPARFVGRIRGNGEELVEVFEFQTADQTRSGLNLIGVPYRIDGNIVIDNLRHVRLRSYTVAQLEALPSTPAGQVVRCSNGDSGQPCLAVSKGTTQGWARVPLGANVSAT
jgi:hypothetical protein